MPHIFPISVALPSGALRPLETANPFLEAAFHTQSNQFRAHTPWRPPFLPGQALTLSYYCPALIIPRPGFRHWREPITKEPEEVIQTLPIFNPHILPHQLFPGETTETLAHVFPSIPLPPDGIWCFPMWPHVAWAVPSFWEL